MPIYEYACKHCDHRLDALQKMSEDPLTDCPSCGEAKLKRLISAPRFRLKGKGWYETDFKKDNQRNLLKSDTESAKPDKDKKASAKADDKSSGTKKTTTKPASTGKKSADKSDA